jgi:hypothetical protein
MCIGVAANEWPPSDIVTAFYARAGQECRFDQKQREFGFQKIHSRNPAGQCFAAIVAAGEFEGAGADVGPLFSRSARPDLHPDLVENLLAMLIHHRRRPVL